MRDASASAGGYIRLYRSLLDWEWFQDSRTLHVFLFLLLSACFKPIRHAGVDLAPGQLITSFRMIARHTGLTDAQVRTAIAHLKSTHEITQQSNARFTLITLNNFARYQALLPHAAAQTAHAPPAHQPHKNKNDNPVNQEKKKGVSPYGSADEDNGRYAALSGLGLCI